ncbi:hypothetical protein D3C77_450170 [compost metagenome]
MPATGGVAIPKKSRKGINQLMMSMLPTTVAKTPSAMVICHFGMRSSKVETTSVP